MAGRPSGGEPLVEGALIEIAQVETVIFEVAHQVGGDSDPLARPRGCGFGSRSAARSLSRAAQDDPAGELPQELAVRGRLLAEESLEPDLDLFNVLVAVR